MATTTFSSLLRLDDMTLRKIASYLNVLDLINFGNTCKRFKYLTKQHLEKYFRSIRWRKNHNALRICDSRNVFLYVGKYLQKINLAHWTYSEFYDVLEVLATNCSHLNSMVLESIRMNCPLKNSDHVLRTMFSKLKQFSLKRCDWRGWCPLQRFFGQNSTLEQLSVIECCKFDGNIFKLQLKEFTGLQELHLIECRHLLSSVELQRCFENNDIGILSLTNVGDVNILEQHLINSVYNSVKSLTFDFHEGTNFDQLGRIINLKNLRLQCHNLKNVDKLISIVNPGIQQLEVRKMFITKATMDSLGKFTKLSHLTLESCSNSITRDFFTTLPRILPDLQQLVYTYNVVTDSDIISMFRLMPKLRHLSLLGCNSLSTDTYAKIVEILSKDSKRPKLKFIPPQLESLKCLRNFQKFQKVIHGKSSKANNFY